MKAISLWQPWASLLFAPGELRKVYETRPRTMGFEPGERIAIQAAGTDKGIRLCRNLPLDEALWFAKAIKALYRECLLGELPRGCLIGTVEVGKTMPVEELSTPSLQEQAFGDWSPGRFAIQTQKPVLFAEPIHYQGMQGVFYVPDRVIASATPAPLRQPSGATP